MDIIDALSDLSRLDDLADLGDTSTTSATCAASTTSPTTCATWSTSPIGDLTPSEIQRLTEARNAIKIEPGTPMQRVIPEDVYNDYLRGSSSNPRFSPDESFGFTARAEDVAQLRTPREMYDDLGLDYKDTEFSPDQAEIKVLRYRAEGPGDFNIPRHSDLGGRRQLGRRRARPDRPVHGQRLHLGRHPGVPQRLAVRHQDRRPDLELSTSSATSTSWPSTDLNGWLAVPR